MINNETDQAAQGASGQTGSTPVVNVQTQPLQEYTKGQQPATKPRAKLSAEAANKMASLLADTLNTNADRQMHPESYKDEPLPTSEVRQEPITKPQQGNKPPKRKKPNDWHPYLFESFTGDSIPKPKPLINIGDNPCFPIGELVAIIGQEKSGKSTFAQMVAASLLANGNEIAPITQRFPSMVAADNDETNGATILYADTEQGEYDAYIANKRMYELSALSESEYRERMKYLRFASVVGSDDMLAVLLNAIVEIKPSIVFLDGLADLLGDTNDLKESRQLIRQIMTYSQIYDCCIVGITHTNPTKAGEYTKASGHLGTIVQRKATEVIEVTSELDCKVVRWRAARRFDNATTSISWRYENGAPVETDLNAEKEAKHDENVAAKKAKTKETLTKLFSNLPAGEYRKRQLVDYLKGKMKAANGKDLGFESLNNFVELSKTTYGIFDKGAAQGRYIYPAPTKQADTQQPTTGGIATTNAINAAVERPQPLKDIFGDTEGGVLEPFERDNTGTES